MRRCVCLSVACLDLTRERKGLESPKLAGRMEAHHTSNPCTYLEFKRSTVKVTRPINTVIESVSYLLTRKAYEVKTWYADGARKPVLPTSDMTSSFKVKGQGRTVTWCVWQVLGISQEWKISKILKLVGRLSPHEHQTNKQTDRQTDGFGHSTHAVGNNFMKLHPRSARSSGYPLSHSLSLFVLSAWYCHGVCRKNAPIGCLRIMV